MTTYGSTNPQRDASTIARALADRAEVIVTAFFGEPTARSRREQRWRKRGSFLLHIAGPNRGRWSDFESSERGDMLDLVARQLNVPLGEAMTRAKREFLGGPHIPPTSALTPLATVDNEGRAKAAHRRWLESGPIGGLGKRYFIEHRRLNITQLHIDHALRWHDGIRAVVALMTDPISAEPLGVHRTFLDADGAKLHRKMLGPQGVVRLSPGEAVTAGLGITEGIEYGLAVLLSGWSPVWAATSSGAVARVSTHLPFLPMRMRLASKRADRRPAHEPHSYPSTVPMHPDRPPSHSFACVTAPHGKGGRHDRQRASAQRTNLPHNCGCRMG